MSKKKRYTNTCLNYSVSLVNAAEILSSGRIVKTIPQSFAMQNPAPFAQGSL